MTRRPPGSTRTDTLFPYTTLFRSHRKARRISASGPVRDAPAGWALGGRDPAAELRFRAAACRAPWRDARSSPRRRGTGTQRVCYAQRIPPEPAGSAARYGVDLGAARYSRGAGVPFASGLSGAAIRARAACGADGALPGLAPGQLWTSHRGHPQALWRPQHGSGETDRLLAFRRAA